MKLLRRAWTRCPSRCRAFLRWSLPLVAVALLVAADWWRYHEAGIATPAEARRLFLRVGAALAAAVVVKVLFTRRWTLQDLGWVLALAGTAWLFVRFFGRWGPRPEEAERDLVQATLDVGAAVLLVGLAAWAVTRLPREKKE